MEILFHHPKSLPNDDPFSPPDLRRGDMSWILQGFQHFHRAGIPCRLVKDLPASGLIVSYRDHLPLVEKPDTRRFLVCVEAERSTHPWSNIDIVQSPCKAMDSMGKRRLYFPHYPQPGIRPRDPSRGDRFENIVYFGLHLNLDDRLRSPKFNQWMNEQGMSFIINDRTDEWSDYRNADAVLAVRRLGELIDNKPASKLVNAWRAGVPAIVGLEDAFRHYRRSEFDFIEVGTLDELKAAVLKLRDDPTFRQRLTTNGLERARGFTAESTTATWHGIFEKQIIPAAEEWFASPAKRRAFFAMRSAILVLRRIKHALPGVRGLRLRGLPK